MFAIWFTTLLLVQSDLIFTSVKCDCPTRGKIGGSPVPNVLALTRGQSGFSATIEIITPETESIMVSDYYNGAKQFGQIEVNKLFSEVESLIYYYFPSNEKFSIENDGPCESSKLDLLDKYKTIETWLDPDTVLDEVSLFGDMSYLGPTVLMVWANSVSSQAQYVGTETIDGRSVKHWFHCLADDNIWVDFWFDESNLPFRFRTNRSDSDTQTNPHVYNYLIFNPLITSTSDIVPYPTGYGCTRSSTVGLPEFPSFAKSETFSLDMEAMIKYTDPAKVTLSSARLIKYQGTYSIEVNDSPNTTLIIQNPSHRGRYIVDVLSGQCQLDSVEDTEIGLDSLAVKWPYHYDPGFNLFRTVSSISGAYSYYMGQVNTDAGLMDVWEDGLYSFFSSVNNIDAVVTYYFPAIDRSSAPDQAPVKIVIKPINTQNIALKAALPYQIEIVIIDYTEGENFQLSDRFDVSGCYDGPGQFTWFQIVMSDGGQSVEVKDLSDIKSYFQQAFNSFIPVIRIPEVEVTMYQYSYYITGKLLERPPFVFNYESYPGYYIANPNSILIRDSIEDCGDLCTNDLYCTEFSYCSDFTCQIFNSRATYGLANKNSACTWYSRRSYEAGSTVLERNILASSRSILSQIKTKVNNGEFVLTKLALSAEDMFIVSGPEQVGGIVEELNDDQVDPLKGDEYTVIETGRRLSSASDQYATIMGLSYSECLQLCQNDDDCYTLSYCYNVQQECTISTETKLNLTKSLAEKTSLADNCYIFEKSFVAFYRKFPGQSLVKDTVSTLFDIDESECARVCYESTNIPCKSFDFCLQSTGNYGESSQRACFLHEFHVVEDTAHEISSDNIWDFSRSTCDHYAVQLSRDYVHYVGRQYKTGSVTIMSEIEDVSMERCAADCNQGDDDEDDGDDICISFEYCELVTTRGSSNIRTTCRLSPSLTTGDNDLSSSLDTSALTSSTCSVYINKERASKLSQFKSQNNHIGLAIGLGSFFFITAFVAGIVGSVYFKRRFS